MGGTIIPLRPSGEARTPPARIDLAAADLLTAGRTTSLQAARIEAILTDLRGQRDRFAAILADLLGREPVGQVDADAAGAALVLVIAQGIVQIDAFIARTRTSIGTGDGAYRRP